MSEPSSVPLARGTLRATISGVGRVGPIEERVGRRLIRLVLPDSREGLLLLRSGRVSFVGPEGACVGAKRLAEARRLLRQRLERLAATGGGEPADAAREALDRLLRVGPGRSRARVSS